jgi:hypothetical protein
MGGDTTKPTGTWAGSSVKPPMPRTFADREDRSIWPCGNFDGEVGYTSGVWLGFRRVEYRFQPRTPTPGI